MPTALEGLSLDQLIPQGGNKFTARYPSNADTVLSIQPGGEWSTRPNGTAGAWEVADKVGDSLKYSVDGHTYFVLVK